MQTEARPRACSTNRAAHLMAAGLTPDYLALVDGTSLEPIASARRGSRLIAAARLGSVRLLDNVAVG